MIEAVRNIITSPALAHVAQNTTAALTIETGLKAIGRPGFILIDNRIKPETKKYAAAKEFLYQASCLAVYMVLIVPVFKKGAFKLAKNKIFKEEQGFGSFKNATEYLDYHKIASRPKKDRITALSKDKYKDSFIPELRDHLKAAEDAEKYPLIKGVIELGNIVGSVLGLAILAPQVSHVIVHPALKALGLENKSDGKLDKKA